MNSIDPQLDLTLQRVIRAPRDRIWRAWTEADQLQQWWVPAPAVARIDRLDVRPGGAFVTSLRDDGETFSPHTDGIFLVVEPDTRLVFSNAIDSAWRPAKPAPVVMTAEIRLVDHAEGIDYQVTVRHGSREDRDLHVSLGFFEGWGAVTAALAAIAESSDS